MRKILLKVLTKHMKLSTNCTVERMLWIDIYKGIAILLVVLGHLNISKTLYDFIFMFHMYAFFFITGVTFKVKNGISFSKFFLGNIKKLYIPYLFFAFAWDFVHVVTTIYIQSSFDFSPGAIAKNILSVLIGGVIESNASIGPAWFLLALFVVRIVCWITIKVSKDNLYFFGGIAATLFALGYICQDVSFLPFKIGSTLTAFIFVFWGYALKSILNSFRKVNMLILFTALLVCFAITAILSVFADRTVTLVANMLPANWIVTLVGGASGCTGLLFLALLLEPKPIMSRLLAFFGSNSMIVMGIHSEINFACRLLFDIVGLEQKYHVLFIFLMTMALSIPICAFFNRYFPILGGKEKVVYEK